MAGDYHENGGQECRQNEAEESPLYHKLLQTGINKVVKVQTSTDLHSNQITGLSPELCLPDVVLSEIKGPLILEHIWHQRHKILEILFLKVNSQLESDLITLMSEAGMMSK